MSQEITDYISNLSQPWQAEVCQSLHRVIHEAVPEATERLQYGKPHYLKGGKYVAALGAAKGWITLTIFNTAALEAPEGLFEPGPPERKTLKIRQGQAVDYHLLSQLLQEAANTV